MRILFLFWAPQGFLLSDSILLDSSLSLVSMSERVLGKIHMPASETKSFQFHVACCGLGVYPTPTATRDLPLDLVFDDERHTPAHPPYMRLAANDRPPRGKPSLHYAPRRDWRGRLTAPTSRVRHRFALAPCGTAPPIKTRTMAGTRGGFDYWTRSMKTGRPAHDPRRTAIPVTMGSISIDFAPGSPMLRGAISLTLQGRSAPFFKMYTRTAPSSHPIAPDDDARTTGLLPAAQALTRDVQRAHACATGADLRRSRCSRSPSHRVSNSYSALSVV
ncbi:hypothetical protein B0H11DRAFT_50251 [Mycena galericulata]|nr:hypothetical protein B0H11DRAFT_50251 [Mycena galericulata]